MKVTVDVPQSQLDETTKKQIDAYKKEIKQLKNKVTKYQKKEEETKRLLNILRNAEQEIKQKCKSLAETFGDYDLYNKDYDEWY